MTGISEILILILIIVVVLILPRFFKPQRVKPIKKKKSISPYMRMLIVGSVFLPAFTAFIVRPWVHNYHLFIYIGILPVLLIWSIYWIVVGFKKR